MGFEGYWGTKGSVDPSPTNLKTTNKHKDIYISYADKVVSPTVGTMKTENILLIGAMGLAGYYLYSKMEQQNVQSKNTKLLVETGASALNQGQEWLGGLFSFLKDAMQGKDKTMGADSGTTQNYIYNVSGQDVVATNKRTTTGGTTEATLSGQVGVVYGSLYDKPPPTTQLARYVNNTFSQPYSRTRDYSYSNFLKADTKADILAKNPAPPTISDLCTGQSSITGDQTVEIMPKIIKDTTSAPTVKVPTVISYADGTTRIPSTNVSWVQQNGKLVEVVR